MESLIVRYRCKLELWDDDSGLAENPDRPDLVIDQTSRLNLGRNKYVTAWGTRTSTNTWTRRSLLTGELQGSLGGDISTLDNIIGAPAGNLLSGNNLQTSKYFSYLTFEPLNNNKISCC